MRPGPNSITFDLGFTVGGAQDALGFLGDMAVSTFNKIAGAVTDATLKATDFERQISLITTIADEDKFGGFNQISAQMREMSMEFGKLPVDTAAAFYEAISTGAKDSADALALTHAANRMAIAGNSDLMTSVQGLTGVMNAYARPWTEAEDVSDSFFTAIKLGKTTAEELSVKLGLIAPTAKNAGVSLEELLASIATITAQGVSTSEAVSGIRGAISNIEAPSRKARDEAARLGIEFNGAALRAKGLRGVLEDITTSANFNADSMSKLFGAIRGGNAVLGIATNDFAIFDNAMSEMEVRAGATDQAFEKMSSTLDYQVQIYRSLKANAEISFGTLLVRSDAVYFGLTAVNEQLGDVVKWMDSEEGQKKADEFFRVMISGAATAVEAMIGMVKMTVDTGIEIEKLIARVTGDTVAESLDNLERYGQGIAFAEQLVDRLRAGMHKRREEDKKDKESGIRPRAPTMADKSDVPEDDSPDVDKEAERIKQRQIKRSLTKSKNWFDAYGEAIERNQRLAEFLAKQDDENFEKMKARQDAITEKQRQFFGDLWNIGAQGIGNFVGSVAEGIATGTLDLGVELAKFGSTILSSIGDTMISAGTAALAASAAAAFFPFLVPLLGPPMVGVPAALGLIAAGATLKGLGALVGLAAQPDKAPAPPATSRNGPGSPRVRTGTPVGGSGFGSGMGGPVTENLHVHLAGERYVVGSPATLGRDIRRGIREYDRLRDDGRIDPFRGL